MNFDTFSFRPLDPDGDEFSSAGQRSILRLGGRKKSIKNRVSFSNRASVEFTDALDDMSEHEKNDYWYDFDEMQNIKRELIGVVKHMQKTDGATLAADDERCSRGLESLRSPAHTEQRNIIRDSVIASVMTEQQRQRELGLPDPDGIASASSNWSVWATDRALELGSGDAKDARVIYKTSVDIPPQELQRHIDSPSIVRSLLDGDEYEDYYTFHKEQQQQRRKEEQTSSKRPPPPSIVEKKQDAPFSANKLLRSLNLHEEHIPVAASKAQVLAHHHHHHAIPNRRPNRSLLVRFNRTGSERTLSVGDSSFNALGKRVSAAIGASSPAA